MEDTKSNISDLTVVSELYDLDKRELINSNT
jgi:hypothetical protein